jgi:hypothetical protein
MEPGGNPGRLEMGDYVFDFTESQEQRGGADAGPETAKDTAAGRTGQGSALVLSFLEAPFVLIVNTSPDEYYFGTNGNYSFRVSPRSGGGIAATASIDQGAFVNGKWILTRRLNGDDIMGGGYDLSRAAANNQAGTLIPLRRVRNAVLAEEGRQASPTVTRIRFYRYN